MKNIFPGHFRPSTQELSELWDNATFVVDANVLLNLYRYSDATRNELMKALESLRDRIYITHQAASEFLRNRLSVTFDQSKEYTTAIAAIKALLQSISNKNRHPFIGEDSLTHFSDLSEKMIQELTKKTNRSSE